jgi:hypothetical protein
MDDNDGGRPLQQHTPTTPSEPRKKKTGSMPSPSQVGGEVGGQVGGSGGKIPPVEVPPDDGVDDLRELAKKKELERLAKLKKDMVEKNRAKFEKSDTEEPEPVGNSGE